MARAGVFTCERGGRRAVMALVERADRPIGSPEVGAASWS